MCHVIGYVVAGHRSHSPEYRSPPQRSQRGSGAGFGGGSGYGAGGFGGRRPGGEQQDINLLNLMNLSNMLS